MPLAPDGTWRRPTAAETDLTDALDAAFIKALTDPDRAADRSEGDPLWLATVAVQAVIDARWTPPTTSDTTRGRDSSRALTEVRTVLSRAEAARELIAALRPDTERPHPVRDPDSDDMCAALDQVIAILTRWRRTGPTTRKANR